VASPDSLDATGKPIYYGGGRLAADLTLPKLRSRMGGRRFTAPLFVLVDYGS
jgi:hypothetical protein